MSARNTDRVYHALVALEDELGDLAKEMGVSAHGIQSRLNLKEVGKSTGYDRAVSALGQLVREGSVKKLSNGVYSTEGCPPRPKYGFRARPSADVQALATKVDALIELLVAYFDFDPENDFDYEEAITRIKALKQGLVEEEADEEPEPEEPETEEEG
jgi:hypothetical protein